ncbi:OB-fold domain-containing protein [Pacificibacter marinus]|nr:OB-fold domain-containing protein [Pacificibacter marinus]
MDTSPITPELTYRNALKEGRFMLQVCSGTGRAVFYPRVTSPWTGNPLTTWSQMSGQGQVYSTTTVRRRADKGGDYNVAIIELAEGARMMSRVENVTPDKVEIGMDVVAKIITSPDGEPIIVFVPKAGVAT